MVFLLASPGQRYDARVLWQFGSMWLAQYISMRSAEKLE